MVGAHQNLNGSRDLTTPLSGMICHPRARTVGGDHVGISLTSLATEKLKLESLGYHRRCLDDPRFSCLGIPTSVGQTDGHTMTASTTLS